MSEVGFGKEAGTPVSFFRGHGWSLFARTLPRANSGSEENLTWGRKAI